ncbi:MAG: diguanylate cyclase [Clostridia bacterium]|nr:diguanylate cyclase [Clostridia bacterium]
MPNQKTGKRVGGVSANALTMPIVVILSILHVLIIAVIVMINTNSSNLSVIMSNAGQYTQEATSLLGGSSLLSETASNYVLMPLTEAGEANVAPLQAYASELSVPRRGSDVVEKFKAHKINPEELGLLETAAESADYMLNAQLHAISLVSSVYPLPQIKPITDIPRVELTPEEQAMTDEQRLSTARTLILGSVYGMNKQSVSQNVNACVGVLQGTSTQMAAMVSQRIGRLRTVLWIITISIVVVLVITFTMLYRQLLSPLGRFVTLIPEDVPLDETRGFREVRLVAAAYNDVLKRRNALDSILRSAAETDALTNLPNRYRFEQYLLESESSGYSMAVLLFDVNYLKQTNDTEGHLAGDRLLRAAADCISSCFGENCFRFGGDEFAAIVKNCTPDSIDRMVAQFEKVEKEQNVSISLGYAYAEEIGSTTFRKLLDEADQKMYAQKKEIHSREA